MIDRLNRSIRARLVREVRATVTGAADGSAVISPSDEALFPPGSTIRLVHGDVVSMMVGGVSALLLQMLHPSVLAGVWDHSDFRDNMLGRLHRTARFIAVTTYAERGAAEAALARVRGIHARIGGTLPDDTPYRADEPRLLAWVHVAQAISFLDAYKRYGSTPITADAEARYFAEFATIGERLGAAPAPRTRAETERFIAAMRPALRVDHRTREVAALVMRPRAASLAALPAQALILRAAADLMPDWARLMHGFGGGVSAPLVRQGTAGMAGALRWAFRGARSSRAA